MNDYSQNNHIPADSPVIYQTQNYGNIGANFEGTFTTGFLQYQGTNDGLHWFPLLTGDSLGVALTDNKIITSGYYRAIPLGFGQVRLYPSVAGDGGAFTGDVAVSALISRRPNPIPIVAAP